MFIQSFVNGYLDFFYLLTMWLILHSDYKYENTFFKILLSILLDKYPEMVLRDHRLILRFLTWGAALIFVCPFLFFFFNQATHTQKL